MTKNYVTEAKNVLIIYSVIFIILAAVTWILTNYYVQIDYSVPTNGTIFHVYVQAVPTIINGIATATSIALGFAVTFVGIITRELLTEHKDDGLKRYLIGKYLFGLPFFLILLFSAYSFLLFGGVFIKTALAFAFIVLIFAILWIASIFVIINPFTDKQEEKTSNRAQQENESEAPESKPKELTSAGDIK
jgi:hypothetical protein